MVKNKYFKAVVDFKIFHLSVKMQSFRKILKDLQNYSTHYDNISVHKFSIVILRKEYSFISSCTSFDVSITSCSTGMKMIRNLFPTC